MEHEIAKVIIETMAEFSRVEMETMGKMFQHLINHMILTNIFCTAVLGVLIFICFKRQRKVVE